MIEWHGCMEQLTKLKNQVILVKMSDQRENKKL